MAETPRQETELNFKEWLLLTEGSRRPGDKTGLYPLGYNGIGLYPLQDYLTHSADAITYMSMDDRLYKGKEGAPFKISHLKPLPTFTHPQTPLKGPKMPKGWKRKDVIEPKDERAPGKTVPPKYKIPPGDVKRPTSWVKVGEVDRS